MRKVAITGANGYVGSVIAAGLAAPAVPVRLVRRPEQPGDIAWSLAASEEETAASLAKAGATDLIHAAWDMQESKFSNVERSCVRGSERLIRAARRAGITRIVFISTISAFDEAESSYGRAKRIVETYCEADGVITLRLGLVHGDGNGGVVGGLRSSIRRSPILPMIGFGRLPQYLLPERWLQDAIAKILAGRLDGVTEPVTLADPAPIPFVDLVRRIAREESRAVRLVPVPWRLLHAGLAGLEHLGIQPPMRSDSVLSFVRANRKPDFSVAAKFGLLPLGQRSPLPDTPL